jgi:alkylation response protein AidB-like acyl-CoA dehydrogenase
MPLQERSARMETLEKKLGDPRDPANAISYARGALIDEEERFPREGLEALYALELQEFHIPQRLGGWLSSYEDMLLVTRLLARRDLSVMVTFATTAWSTLAWLGGTPEQQERLARFLRARKSTCLAYSEEKHGADLLAGETVARKVPGGYRISGEKWPINRATQGEGFMLLARTDPAGGPRGLSLFMIDKADLEPGGHEPLPRVKTVGVRGIDLSGVRFKDCFVREQDRLGPEGAGLELALKGLHITRALCGSLSLGALDTGLRTTLNLARSRRLYGDVIFSIPNVAATCAEAFLDLLVAECTTQAAIRGLHVAPESFSVWSAIVKCSVPTLAERAFQRLTTIQGARAYLRDKHDWGVFQRFSRDNQLIGIFDGSTVVNLHSLALQLRQLAQGYNAVASGARQDEVASQVEQLFTLATPAPTFEPKRLDLIARGRDAVVQGVLGSAQRLEALAGRPGVDATLHGALQALTRRLIDRLNATADDVSQLATRAGRAFSTSPEIFELAARYCTLFSAASCLQTWVYNHGTLGPFFDRGEWLALALDRLLREAGGQDLPALPAGLRAPLVAELTRLHDENRLFSLTTPLQLA